MKADEYKKIDKSKFEFVDKDSRIVDEKIATKPVGYMLDVWRRFKKNKASVVAAVIIVILLLFALIVPFLSPYTVSFADGNMSNALPKLFKSGTGFWDGTQNVDISKLDLDTARAIDVENEWQKGVVKDPEYAGIGLDGNRSPIIKIKKVAEGADGKKTYSVNRDSYFVTGYIYEQITYLQYVALQEYQNQTGKRVIYPMVDYSVNLNLNSLNANYWYKYTAVNDPVSGEKANTVVIKFDEQGNYVPNYAIYSTNSLSYYQTPYSSIRQAGDPGIEAGDTNGISYAYARLLATADTGKPLEEREVRVRVSYYDYFVYKNGREPKFLFGLTAVGRDLLVCIAYGARVSFMLSIVIASINLIIGTFLGALMGYYGGTIDLTMQRIIDILAGIPFIVVVVLFQIYVQSYVGIVGSFIFAFILTGWIAMADRVRAQFYRYKGHEYVLAARTLGARDRRLMFRHIFPNAIGTIITGSILMIPSVIFTESTLSYLGIVNLEGPNTTSLGTLLFQGQGALQRFPHNIFFPAIFIALLMIAFNLFGNGLRDAFNPSLRGSGD